jgi:hypothetical protein
LVLDSFTAHKTNAVKNRFHEKKTNLAVIPGGLTSRLQPLDVSLNKPFKAKVRNLYNHWMSEAIKDYTPSGKIKRPSYSLVANWVKESWEAMDTNMIKRSFKCYGVSNNVNGSEDILIYFNKVNKDNFGREVEENNEEDNDNEDDDDNNESNGEESDENTYYQENEEEIIIQDWD